MFSEYIFVTPQKTNMEPPNGSLEYDFPFHFGGDFQLPAVSFQESLFLSVGTQCQLFDSAMTFGGGAPNLSATLNSLNSWKSAPSSAFIKEDR